MATAARLLRAPAPRPQPRPRLEVASSPSSQPAKGRKTWPIVVTGVVALALIFGVLLEQVILAQSAFELSNKRKELAEARSVHGELLLDAATLESPGRIELYARRKLGMVDPDPLTTQYVVADINTKRTARGGVAAGPAVIVEGDTVALEDPPTSDSDRLDGRDGYSR